MRLLEAAGYYCTRSGGSLGVFDVIGIGSIDVVLVQVTAMKSTNGQGIHGRHTALASL